MQRILTFAFLVSAFLRTGLAQEETSNSERPRILKGALISGEFAAAFDPNTPSPVLLEASADLEEWTPLLNAATSQERILFHDQHHSFLKHRFYRLRAPGSTVEDSRSAWQSKAPVEYQFRFERVTARVERLPQSEFRLTQTSLAGTIHVAASGKTVSDVRIDDVPADAFDPGEFLSIDELFDALGASVDRRADEVLFTYDPKYGFPRRVHIHDVSENGDDVVEYRVMDFQVEPTESE